LAQLQQLACHAGIARDSCPGCDGERATLAGALLARDILTSAASQFSSRSVTGALMGREKSAQLGITRDRGAHLSRELAK
jgi:hypothetical protein